MQYSPHISDYEAGQYWAQQSSAEYGTQGSTVNIYEPSYSPIPY